MLKILSLNLIVFSTLLLLYPVCSTSLFAQDDDFFGTEAEDWSDDVLDDPDLSQEESETSVVTEKEVTAPEKKKTNKPAKKVKKATAKKEIKSIKEPVVEQAAPVPAPVEKKPPVVITAPIAAQPRFDFNPILQPEQNVKSGKMVQRAGPPLVLIARPTYAPYTNETKTKHIAGTAEAYFHFKLGAVPGIAILPTDEISNTVQYFRDFSRRISSSAYKEAAKKMGASYLFYSEYEPNGKKVKFATEIFSIADNKKIAGSTAEIETSNFENGLYDLVIEAAGAISGTLPQESQEFLAEPVMTKKADRLGEVISSIGNYSKKNAESVLNQLEKLAKNNSFHLAKFIAADIFSLAEDFDNATSYMQDLEDTFGNQYPALNLSMSRIYRLKGSYDEALSSANKVADDPSLSLLAQIEKAKIQEARGNLQQAKTAYESVLSKGQDGEILLRLALVSISLNDLRGAQRYLDKTASAGRSLNRKDYFNLGLRYESIGATEDAIKSYRYCLGIQQDNEEAWQKLADLYIQSGKQPEAAECYVNLFQINNTLYKDYLFKAGTMFEEGGYYDNAKDVYELFLARRFSNQEVKVRLAKIEIYNGKCDKAIQLVNDIDTTGEFGEDVRGINSHCKKEVRIVVASQTSDKSWKAVFFWRLSSGLVMIGSGAAGYVLDQMYVKKVDEYNEYTHNNPEKTPEVKVAEVQALRSEAEDLESYRNIAYAASAVGAGSLVLSFVIPIVLP